MSKSVVAVLCGLVGVVLVSIIAFVAMYVSASNYGASAESNLSAALENNANILGQYTIKVQEVAQVPNMYKDHLKEIITAEFQGRYGKEGSQASMQWIKERSNNFDSSMYVKVQQVMEAGRNQFQAAQTRMIDQKREYVTSLNTIPQGFFLHMAGYPRLNLDSIKPVVASTTQREIESGIGQPINIH